MMKVRATPQTASALASMMLLAAGCSSGNASNPAPAPTAVTVAPPSTTQAGTPAEQAALTDAIKRYWTVYSSVYNNPRQDMAIVDTVAAGEEAASLRDQAAQVAAQGIVSSGAIKLGRVS